MSNVDSIPDITITKTKAILYHIIDSIGREDSQGIFLWGPPGIGKSALVKQLAAEKGRPLVDLRLPLMDPVDLRGLPMVDKEKKQAKWLPPDFLPGPDSPPGILFLDEINAASPAIQASAYQLVLDRKVGTYALPADWIVIAAGNRVTDRSVAYKLPTALANRFTHLQINPSIDEWTQWAWKNQIDPLIIGFLRYHPNILMDFDPRRNSTAFASPRSWSFVSHLSPLLDQDFALYISAVQGTVGEAAKQQFMSFLNYRDGLPDPNDILNGNAYEMPAELDSLYVLLGSLIQSLIDNVNDERVGNFYQFAAQHENTPYADFSLVLVKELISAFKELRMLDKITNHPEYTKWLTRHTDMMFH